MEVQESERRFLASELHDQIGQNLTALSINLNVIRSRFSEEVDIKIIDRLEDSLKLVEETIERMRSVMAGLRPPVLDDYGLAVALRWYTERFSERNAVVTVVQEKEFLSCLPLTVETALFRIVQEVLTNVSKHANAKSPLESLSLREREILQLVVEGKSSAEISIILTLSRKTVETYRSRLMQKLGIKDIPGLVKFAILHGLTKPE